MFWHNFKYSCKVLLHNKMLLFWTFVFPILLGTFFKMAFSDIENNEKLDIIPIAVVESRDFTNNSIFGEVLKTLSEEGENQLFSITYTNLDQCKNMLIDGNIDGYLTFYEDDVSVTVSNSGINETILRYVVDEIQSRKKMTEVLVERKVSEEISNGNFDISYDAIISHVAQLFEESHVTLHNATNHNLSYTMIEYYTLIAMACLYSSMISMFITNYKLANMAAIGKRVVVSPTHKTFGILGSFVASYFVGAIGVSLLYLYTIFVLQVDYGSQLPKVVLLSVVGLLAGQLLGVAVSTLVKSNENTKTGVLLAISMFGSFLAGMMGITMKYVIDTNVPILNWINPVNMITDGLYSLYYYDTFTRFYFNVISLLLFSVLMILLSYRGLRRQRYDSI